MQRKPSKESTIARNDLMQEIAAFQSKFDLTDTKFGELAMNDSAWLHRLKKKKRSRFRPVTAEKIRAFMVDYVPAPPVCPKCGQPLPDGHK